MASSGLNMLSGYGSDEENSEPEEVRSSPVKPKLPLPNAIKNLFDKETKELNPGINLLLYLNITLICNIQKHLNFKRIA